MSFLPTQELHTISVKLNTRCKGDFWLMDFVANLALQGGLTLSLSTVFHFVPEAFLQAQESPIV